MLEFQQLRMLLHQGMQMPQLGLGCWREESMMPEFGPNFAIQDLDLLWMLLPEVRAVDGAWAYDEDDA